MRVEIEVPDKVLEFLRDVARLTDLDVEGYLRGCVVEQFRADLEHIATTPFWKLETLKAKYGLEEILG